jgi:hypothetical protein
VLVDLSAAGKARAPWVLHDMEGGTLLSLASSRETGLCAVTSLKPDPLWELTVLRPTGGTFELVHRSEVPGYAAIVRDADARQLLLYCERPLVLTPIGPTAPELPAWTPRPTPWISDVCDVPACLGSAGLRAEAYRAVAASVKDLPAEAVAAASRRLQKEESPAQLVERARALTVAGETADADRLRTWLWEHHPEAASVRLLRADERVRLGRWDEVRDLLAPCTPASFPGDEDQAQHVSHLRALAALHLGDVEEARRRAAEAAEHPGSCQLEGLAAVLHPRPALQAAVREGADATEDVPLLTQLVWAIHAADARLAAGDPEGALAALDPRRFEVGNEVQVLARRAEAWLGLAPQGVRRFDKIMELARLLQADEGDVDEDGERTELPVPGATWDRARLVEVLRRAAAWLEAHGGEESG